MATPLHTTPPQGGTPHPGILETMGTTPLVQLHRLAGHAGPVLLAKLDFFTPDGQPADRYGLAMLLEAEQSGRLQPGSTIVRVADSQPGVCLAIAAAQKGYHVIMVAPDRISPERAQLLQALG